MKQLVKRMMLSWERSVPCSTHRKKADLQTATTHHVSIGVAATSGRAF